MRSFSRVTRAKNRRKEWRQEESRDEKMVISLSKLGLLVHSSRSIRIEWEQHGNIVFLLEQHNGLFSFRLSFFPIGRTQSITAKDTFDDSTGFRFDLVPPTRASFTREAIIPG